jgi:hypothetical protein
MSHLRYLYAASKGGARYRFAVKRLQAHAWHDFALFIIRMAWKKHRGWKIAGIILVILLAIPTGLSVWISNDYKRILKQKIPVWASKATDSLYRVSVEDISINLFTRDITVTGLCFQVDSAVIARMHPDSVPATVFDISAPKVHIENVRWADIVADKEAICGRLLVQSPKINIYTAAKFEDSVEQKAADSLLANEEKKQPKIELLRAGEITVTNPEIHYEHRDTSRTLHYHAKGGTISLYDWEFNSEKPKAPGRFFFAKRAELDIDSFRHSRDGGHYVFSSGKLKFSTSERKAEIRDFLLKTPYSKEDFYQKVGRQQDLFDIAFPVIKISGLQWEQLLDSNFIIVSKIELEKARLEDYYTRLAPPNTKSKLGNFPNQLLLKLPIGLYIPEISIKEGYVKYTEVNEKTRRPGDIIFSNVNGSVKNVTNMPGHIAQNGHCIIELRSGLNGNSPLHTTFSLSLKDCSGGFTVDSRLENLEASQVNATAKALALASIDSLYINSLDIHVEGDERQASGTVTMRYKNLKISLLEAQKDGSEVDLEEKGTLSFLANSLLVYNHNPMPGEPVRVHSDQIDRDQYKSFFNLIWRTIYNSILETALNSEAVEEAIKNKQKKKDKPGILKRIFGKKKGDK